MGLEEITVEQLLSKYLPQGDPDYWRSRFGPTVDNVEQTQFLSEMGLVPYATDGSGGVDPAANGAGGGRAGLGQGVSDVATSLGLGLMAYGEAGRGLAPGSMAAGFLGGLLAGHQADAAGRAAAHMGDLQTAATPGVMAVSDPMGNIIGVSSPASVAAADAAMFGDLSDAAVADAAAQSAAAEAASPGSMGFGIEGGGYAGAGDNSGLGDGTGGVYAKGGPVRFQDGGAAFGVYPSAGRRPERLNQSRDVNAPLQLARGWTAGLLGLPGDVEGLVRMLPGLDETPRLPTSDFYREYLPGYDPRPAARAMSGLGALAGGAGATGVVRGGLGAVKRATDVNAIRDYVRATQGLSGLPGTAVVKPKGGNWLKGPGSPEDTVQALKVRDRYGMTDPTELSAALGIPLEEAQALQASNAPNAAINQWLDQKLARYIRNEMGTPEDPLRALVLERGVSHVPLETLEEGAGHIPSEVALARKQAGFPEIGMVEEGSGVLYGDLSDLQRAASGWETAADVSIRGERAGDLMRLGEGSPTVRANPWLAKVPPETPVYSFKGFGEADLGFSHLVDELRNATAATSDLPAELRLTPEQLRRVSMPQAVELVDRINKWRANATRQAQLEAQKNVDIFREYPTVPGTSTKNESGLRWARLNKPGQFKYESDHMGHSVRGYEPVENGGSSSYGLGGWEAIQSGKAEVYSLRDAKGEPHVTVEVARTLNSPFDGYERSRELAEAVLAEADPSDLRKFARRSGDPEEYLASLADDLGKYHGEDSNELGMNWLQELSPKAHARLLNQVSEPSYHIQQIKGKANKAPKDEYLPYVQDFVRSGQWEHVGDLDNAKLMTHKEAFGHLYSIDPKLAHIFADNTPVPEGYFSLEDLDRLSKPGARVKTKGGPGQGFARGGVVSAGPAQYDPARISALADQLLMEA